MGLVSKIYCERKLPIPLEDFGEDEETDFKDIVWDELPFYTSSFYDRSEDEGYGVSNYTISEDGQFYRNKIKYDIIEDEEGGVEIKETDEGIERKDFTGEIHFGTEIMGKNYDYIMTFEALFFKGDLKELNAYEWKRIDNKDRKKREEILKERVEIETQNKNKQRSVFLYCLKWLPFQILNLLKWILIQVMTIVIKLQIWIKG
jgi:hypothetical protein